MAEMTWEKSPSTPRTDADAARKRVAMVGFVLFMGLALLLVSGTLLGRRFFITVNEVVGNQEMIGQSVKLTGAVLGESIDFDPTTQTITFTIAHITDDMGEIERNGGLAETLHLAVNDSTAQRLDVVVREEAMPDMLKDEAQAILVGRMGTDGVFYADELQLRCPSRYESDVPEQSAG